jgi:O6-methylguanine-DNA--protein-cysteine methyltransferase
VSPVLAATAGQDEPLSTELQEELQAAWVELTEAARGSRVTSFHACTRTGRPWTEDPAAVRAVAATLREFPVSDSQ